MDNLVIATNTSYPPDFEVLHNWGNTVQGMWGSLSKKGRNGKSEVLLRYKGGAVSITTPHSIGCN